MTNLNNYITQVQESRALLRDIVHIIDNQDRNMTRMITNSTLNTTVNRLLNNTTSLFPSNTEISEATTDMSFSEIENPINTQCPITHEDFQPDQLVTRINHCGHIFSRNELAEWFRFGSHCPVCRHNIRNTTNNNDRLFEYTFYVPNS